MPVVPNLPKKQPKGTAKGAKAAAAAKGKKGSGSSRNANIAPTFTPPHHCNLCGLFIVPGEMVTLYPCLHMLCFPCMLDHQASTKYHNKFICPRMDCEKPVAQYEYCRKIMHQGNIKLVPQPRRTVRFDVDREWTVKNLTALHQSTTTIPFATTTAAEQPQPQQPLPPPHDTATTTTDTTTAIVDLMQEEELQQQPLEVAEGEAASAGAATGAAANITEESDNTTNDFAKITRPPARKPTEFTTKSIRLQDLERMPRDMRRILAGLQSKVAKVLKTPHEPGKIPAFDVVAYFRTLAPLQSSAGGRPAKDAKIIARNLCMAYNEESLRNFLACWLTPEQAAELPFPDDPGFEIIYGQDNVVFDSTITRLNMGVREEKLKDDDEDAVSSGNEWED